MRRMRKFCFFVIEVNSESELCVFFGTLIQTTSLDQISFCAQKEKQQHVIYLPWTPFVLFSDQTSSKADATSKVSATFCKKLQVNSFFTPTRLQFYFLPKSHLFLNYFCWSRTSLKKTAVNEHLSYGKLLLLPLNAPTWTPGTIAFYNHDPHKEHEKT